MGADTVIAMPPGNAEYIGRLGVALPALNHRIMLFMPVYATL